MNKKQGLMIHVDKDRDLYVPDFLDQIDRIERMLKWWLVKEHMDMQEGIAKKNYYDRKNCNRRRKRADSYAKQLPDISDIIRGGGHV